MINRFNRLGIQLSSNKILFYILNFTWGLPLTILGYLLIPFLLPYGKLKRFEYVLYFQFNEPKEWGFSLGGVIFGSRTDSLAVKQHEFGHSVQNAILGPLMLFVISIPSAIRYWYRRYLYKHTEHGPKTSYNDIWFELSASIIGNESWDDHGGKC